MTAYKPLDPCAGLLGFSRRPPAPLQVEETPVPVRRNVKLSDVFLPRKPSVPQIRGKVGEIVPATLRGRVLIVLCQMSQSTPGTPLHDSDIVMECWRRYPDFFGLKGYAVPDSSKSRAKLCGSEGLIQHGMVVRVSEGLYEVTEAGHAWWRGVGQPWTTHE